MKKILLGLTSSMTLALLLVLGSNLNISALSIDFGGDSERFKGDGDLVPPRCQFSSPTASTEPFFVQWNCIDNFTEDADIRSELWILRPGATRYELISDFLGFPASVFVDEAILKLTGEQDFTEGLPVSFRLRAYDRAGTATTSRTFQVSEQDNSVDTCSLSIETDATESDGDTTGLPAMTVSIDDTTDISFTEVTSGFLNIMTPQSVPADTCEIDEICSDNELVMFDTEITIEGSSASGMLIVSPGILNVSVTGTASISSAVLTELEVSGSTLIGTTPATVTLTCSQ